MKVALLETQRTAPAGKLSDPPVYAPAVISTVSPAAMFSDWLLPPVMVRVGFAQAVA